jgi:hypothetical protein
VTKQVRVPGTGSFTFPFKQHYDKVSFTLEGVRGEYRHDSAADPSVFGEREDVDSLVEVTPRESGDEVGVTLRPSGDPDIAIREAPEERAETGDHPGHRYDSLGRKNPCDECGHRTVAGSRRPKGIPPDVWKGLNSKEKANSLSDNGPQEGHSAPSTDGVGVLANGGTPELDLSADDPEPQCITFVEEWLRGIDEYRGQVTPAASGGYPAEHRERSVPPIFPSAAVCRPVSKREMLDSPPANRAIQQEWGRLRQEAPGIRLIPGNGQMLLVKSGRPEKRSTLA